MTKNKKTTKRNLTWKLDELPTANDLKQLVEAEVISAEEAREIMFGSPENDKDKIKALEELVEFLQGVITDLSKNRTQYVPIERTVYIDRTIRPYWDRYWANTTKVLNGSGLTFTAENNTKSLGMVTNGSMTVNTAHSQNYANADKAVFSVSSSVSDKIS